MNHHSIKLSNIYKLSSKVITNKFIEGLHENNHENRQDSQVVLDHGQSIHNDPAGKKTPNYNEALCLAFVDNENVFDSLEEAILNSLREQRMIRHTIKLLQRFYAHYNQDTDKMNIEKGVKPEDTMSPKLFML